MHRNCSCLWKVGNSSSPDQQYGHFENPSSTHKSFVCIIGLSAFTCSCFLFLWFSTEYPKQILGDTKKRIGEWSSISRITWLGNIGMLGFCNHDYQTKGWTNQAVTEDDKNNSTVLVSHDLFMEFHRITLLFIASHGWLMNLSVDCTIDC